jgi:biopolymer transport protein ExbD
MAFGSFNEHRKQDLMASMNMIPMVDVMLVLLVIFIVTAPLLTHAVKVDLPKAASTVNITQPEHIQFGIQKNGTLFWNGETVTMTSLPERFSAAAKKKPAPELHIRADRHAYYELVAKVMSTATTAGIDRIGFVTDPAVAP